MAYGLREILHSREHAMSRVASRGLGSAVRAYSEPLRVRPPRTGMRPGTAAGIVQTPF
ncbi:hypothetical protein GCM10009546_41290 [Actinomadura livida]|uniref:Uncharacterized protein n=2 Tax=Actinomadura livida TaxID=79909 RepID=A0ABN1ETR7_9ACTN|nr:hypothetical protein GCM10010208_70990 [Actinomadura livida]